MNERLSTGATLAPWRSRLGAAWRIGLVSAVLFVATPPAAMGQADSEAVFWVLVERQSAMSPGHDHAGHAREWLAFADARAAGDPLVPIARTLAAWHELKAGRMDEARALLTSEEKAASSAGTAQGAKELARAWLTYLDRERLVSALEAFRLREVRYPGSLEELERWPGLAEFGDAPFQDRWGQPWVYSLEPLRSMPSIRGQRYSLASRSLADVPALSEALALPYGGGIVLRPVAMRRLPNRPALVELVDETQGDAPAVVVQEGAARQGVTVAHVSSTGVVLRDRRHWRIARLPSP